MANSLGAESSDHCARKHVKQNKTCQDSSIEFQISLSTNMRKKTRRKITTIQLNKYKQIKYFKKQ